MTDCKLKAVILIMLTHICERYNAFLCVIRVLKTKNRGFWFLAGGFAAINRDNCNKMK